ncbi:MAG: hypothetical protein ACLRPT_09305 [Akkermansia muciniphila]
MFALFHLKDGNFMAVLPVAAPDSLAWLKLERDGTFLVEAGSLGTSPAKPQAVLAVTATDKDIYRACSAVWNKALSLPFIKGRTLPREKKIYPEPFKYLGWCSWEQYKRTFPPSCLKKRPKLEASPSPSGGCWWTTDSRPRKGFSWSVSNPGRTDSPGLAAPDETQKPQIEMDGLWHCYYGLWNGIHPRHHLDDETARGLVRTAKGKILPVTAPEEPERFIPPSYNPSKTPDSTS